LWRSLGTGREQIVAGWRKPDTAGKCEFACMIGMRPPKWTTHLIDDNGVAVEDLKVTDLNGDGKPDIIAAGRSHQEREDLLESLHASGPLGPRRRMEEARNLEG